MPEIRCIRQFLDIFTYSKSKLEIKGGAFEKVWGDLLIFRLMYGISVYNIGSRYMYKLPISKTVEKKLIFIGGIPPLHGSHFSLLFKWGFAELNWDMNNHQHH